MILYGPLLPFIEGSDFVLPKVVFHPYQRSVTVNVSIIDDVISEEVENFTIRGTIVAPDHGLVEVTGSVTIEIIDDDCELKCNSLNILVDTLTHDHEHMYSCPPTVLYIHTNVLR